MLVGLDKIDWSKLQHAYGSAYDVPQLLRDLISKDKKIRADAIYELFGNIWHQGTIYEATVYAVPFLIEILQSPEASDSIDVPVLLGAIASGCGYLEVQAADESNKKYWTEKLNEQGKSFDEELNREHSITEIVRKEISKALPLLIPYLSHSEPEVRRTIAQALGAFPDQRSTFLPLLEQALDCECDEEVQEELTESIKSLESA